MKLSKGANAAVPTSLLAVVISWQSAHAVDAHALLLTGGAVRGDRDLVFFNAPRHVSQAVTLDQEPAPRTARLSVSLPRTEAEVDRIVVAGSVDEGSFGDIAGLTLTVHGADGALLAFEIEDSDSVSAMMFGEFYRRDGAWRFRAVGQGWSSGLAGLVTEFGVSVDEPETPRPAERPRTATGSPDVAARRPAAQPDPLPRGMAHTEPLDRQRTATEPLPLPLPIEASNSTRPQQTRRVDLTRTNHTAEPAPPPPPPNPARADWHPDPEGPARLRWWDGAQWTTATHTPPTLRPRHCARCGNPLRRKMFGGLAACESCPREIDEFLTHWHSRAWRVLTTSGTQGADWDALWASLRYQRIDEAAGRQALRDVGLSYVERLVTFAFADGEVEQAELDAFEHAVTELTLTGPLIDDLRRRMHRGRTLSRLRAGELPTVRTPGLHLDPEERVHVDLAATHVRQLARGPKLTEGRLIGSNKKLRFVGDGTGTELPWSRVVSVHVEQSSVVIAATSARGGATFDVHDPDYVAAALEGALRVAKRLILTPGQRDTRSIPQEVKAEVWQRDGGKCVECGDGHYLEFDHIIPLSRGGATSATNLQILCRACNRAKGARI
ncbi:TerD family protein [Nocardia sp. NPDC052566]|uniref:TerD family protein n=1 Tax=Nocardia sp. NPDC052566 TaxID=3364330 RepID=UPI0037C68923